MVKVCEYIRIYSEIISCHGGFPKIPNVGTPKDRNHTTMGGFLHGLLHRLAINKRTIGPRENMDKYVMLVWQ